MMKSRRNIRGETLTETIIALSILALGVIIASTVIINSLRNMRNARNRIIAVNIAREGIEAVRNIRDTNWLLYSDRRRACWNHDPAISPCDGTTPIEPGTYIVYKHTSQNWRLTLADKNLSADSDGDGIKDNDLDLVPLSFVDIDSGADSDNADGDDDDGTGNKDDLDYYNHMDPAVISPLGSTVRSTAFRRYITIEYLENAPDASTAPSNLSDPPESINTPAEWNDVLTDKDALNRMRITSTVEWTKGGAIFRARLKTILTDHLGRTELST